MGSLKMCTLPVIVGAGDKIKKERHLEPMGK